MEEHHRRLWEEIKTKDSLAFARYADGEIMLLNGVNVSTGTQAYRVDGWHCNREVPIFKNHLRESLSHTEEYYYYGIPCNRNRDCCQVRDYNNVRPLIKTDARWITFANLLSNGNWSRTIEEIKKLSKEVILFTNENTQLKNIPCRVANHFPIPREVVYWYDTNHIEVNEKIQQFTQVTGKVFLFAAGPLSEILIHKLYSAQPNNVYLDVGSTLDHWIHGKHTRPYMNTGSVYHNIFCNFN